MLRLLTPVIALLLFTLSTNAFADVVNQSKHGFTLSGSINGTLSAKQVWAELIAIDKWWSDSHTYSGSANNLYLDLYDKNCFCEKWQDNWVEHLRIVNVQPNKILILQGGLGPLQTLAINGSLIIELNSLPTGQTRLNWQYHVVAYDGNNIEQWPTPVDSVITEQMQRLAIRINKSD
ncbi:MAG: hypothetical protein V2I33_02290 [Kangiellaceae bacterium]|jgi:hypothetical protein|nr:hypothetical protein [Kangiellaceae bacterium]